MSEWQDGLSRTRLDSNTIRHIVELEQSVSEHYDKGGADFVDFLMDIYEKKGGIQPEDLNQAFLSSYYNVTQDISTPYTLYYKSIVDSGRDRALKDLGIEREARRKMRRTAAIGDTYIQDSLDKSFSQVKTVGDEVIKQLTDKWTESGGTSNVVMDLLKEYEDEARDEGLTRQQLRQKLYEIWQGKRFLLERIVRTETVNTYARAQLQEWYEQGVRKVERHEIKDMRTCPLCRDTLDGKIYDVEMLLNGGYVNQETGISSAAYPISFDSHPNCRGSYTPIVNWSVFEEFEKLYLEPDALTEFQNASDVVTQDSKAENVPIEYQEQVQRALEDFGPDYRLRFVPEITESPEWQEDRLHDLRYYYSEGEAQAHLNLEKGENRGKLVQYTSRSGTVLVSGSAGNVNDVVVPILREHAHQAWGAAEEEKKAWVIERYKNKMEEMEFTLEEEGVQIIGDTPFVSPIAKESPEDYFVECYAAYVADPTTLLYFDEPFYDFLRANFINREYIARGGVN